VIIIPVVLTLNMLASDPHSELAAVLSFSRSSPRRSCPRHALGAAPL
jgi:hypothetical protein